MWYYENDNKQWQVTCEAGKKVGKETYWDSEVNMLWAWSHKADGMSAWTQYYANGKKKSESTWRDFRAQGQAKRWDFSGELISQARFAEGRLQ